MALRFYKYGNKSGKLLPRLAKGSNAPTPIHSLRDKEGNSHTNPVIINTILKHFYTGLYAKDVDNYFDSIPLTALI